MKWRKNIKREFNEGFQIKNGLHLFCPLPFEEFQIKGKENPKIWDEIFPEAETLIKVFVEDKVKWQFIHFPCGHVSAYYTGGRNIMLGKNGGVHMEDPPKGLDVTADLLTWLKGKGERQANGNG